MIISIDPGTKGGIVFFYPDSVRPIVAHAMPQTEGDIASLLRCAVTPGTLVIMEKVGGFIKGGAKTGSSMFTFGKNVGFITGVVMALSARLELVPPATWMKALGLGTRSGMATADWKRKLKAEAQRLYPNVAVTLSNCDALLLLEYGRRCVRR